MSDLRDPIEVLIAAQLGLLPEQRPAPTREQQWREDLLRRVTAGSTEASTPVAEVSAATPGTQRLNDGEWVDLLPGVRIKSLRRDATSETTLWRLQPGAVVPPHPHAHEEECLILEGSLVHAGVEYFPGDYVYAAAGEHHLAFTAPNGALFLIRGEPVPSAARLAALTSSH